MAELTVDDGYKNIRIEIDGNIVATQEIIESVSITYGSTDGNAPGVGATYSPHCDVTINSNDIYGNTALEAIQLGALFTVKCELESGTYYTMGNFYIELPPQYTDDYQITFSGEGMLGSVMDGTYVDYTLMETYTDNGVLTPTQARDIIYTQFGILVTWNANTLPTDFLSDAKIIVPVKSKWKIKKYATSYPYKKRFVKITAREWIAGMAVMMGCNAIEYMGIIMLLPLMGEGVPQDYFTYDSFIADFQKEKTIYAPNALYLHTYETAVKDTHTIQNNVFLYKTECECNNIFFNAGVLIGNEYNINIECQWIGRSFEAFYFTDDIYSTDSGDFEDATPIRTYPLQTFSYTPSSWDFSGWNMGFKPGRFVNVQTKKKNTETQAETTEYIQVYIMEMVWNWSGTIDVQISSSFNGELEYKATPTTQTTNSTNSTRSAKLASRSSGVTINKAVTIRIDKAVKALSNAYNEGVIDEETIDDSGSSTSDDRIIKFYSDSIIGG